MQNNRTNTARMLYIVIGVIIGIGIVGGSYLFLNSTDKKNNSYGSITPTPQKNESQLANPASVYCGEKGGQTVIQTNGSGGQYGLCDFGSGMMCEEWAMYRKECPVGGIKTTGFDNIQQKYCAWSGGQTLAVPNATCTFKNGNVCSVDAFYNGTCSPN